MKRAAVTSGGLSGDQGADGVSDDLAAAGIRVRADFGRYPVVTAVLCLALGGVAAAMASLNVALPDLARSTQATQTQPEWIIDANELIFLRGLIGVGAVDY